MLINCYLFEIHANDCADVPSPYPTEKGAVLPFWGFSEW